MFTYYKISLRRKKRPMSPNTHVCVCVCNHWCASIWNEKPLLFFSILMNQFDLAIM